MMIKLACNYSAELLNLLHQEKVTVDWIKLSRWDVYTKEVQFARKVRPVLLHTLPNAAQSNLEEMDWDDINNAIQECSSPHIAIHLSGRHNYWPNHPATIEAIKQRLHNGILYCKGKLDVNLLIENVPYDSRSEVYKCVSDPSFIYSLCEDTGVELLLDLAHLRVAAYHRNESPYDYLDQLPLHRIREIHVCGPEYDPENGLQDRHLEMAEEDYQLLAFTLTKTSPDFVTLEYGGTGKKMEWRSDQDTLERQLQRLSDIVNSQFKHDGI
ncbi:DUF692 family protein [Pontibacillus yanchengensis]|uniref:DUF692 family protein n=1 Tax=Pontibacillus yanchengensis TaxID=462910 RepID=A0ACC7VCH0_9BACI|nr:DUF692 family multinuclear iron-containing protein [Pontibacillus yanchengensis]MYL51854.1 DUF692 family protein [Pontibacillus yanchengensis]